MANPKCPASKKSKPTKKPSKKQAVNPDPDRFVDAHAHELMLGTYAKRLVSFLIDVVSPYENMMKEFFVNIHDIDDKSFDFYSYLRGQKFHVTPELVAHIVELPRVSHPTYPYRKSRSPSFDSIALLLFGFPHRYRCSTLDTGDISAKYSIFFLCPPLAITLAKILNAVGTIATNSTVHAGKLQKLEENYDRTFGALHCLCKAFVKLRCSIYREPSPSRSEESATSNADTDADETDADADSSPDDAGSSSAAS
ncbi:hypothetical protein CJ030_MR7G009304 [Morella rubra]|uniref:Uncharacterized protein n=1 Tax=Morella rubra TaxID=262757 RepID=A0A6A1V096_9ROSI|nr:hypothetical protein CJ030_MR7G009304 [Morella rubra]